MTGRCFFEFAARGSPDFRDLEGRSIVMRIGRVGLVLTMVAGCSLVPALPAHALPSVPHTVSGSYSGSGGVFLPGHEIVFATATGDIAPFGSSTLTVDFSTPLVGPDPNPITSGTSTITTADGTVTGTLSGTANVHSVTPHFDYHMIVTVNGGTGRFDGATGTIHLDGFFTAALAVFSGAATGQVNFSGVPTLVPGIEYGLEGDDGTSVLHVPVTLSAASTDTITATWRTRFVADAPPNQADPASDYTPASGTVTFAPGVTSQTVAISVNGDTAIEADEYIVVQFENPTNVNLGGFWGLGFGSITNDDGATVLPGFASVLEGNSGTVDMNVPVKLSAPSSHTVTVEWNTVPVAGTGLADAGTDYNAGSGIVTFAPGETSKTVTVSVHGDRVQEPDEDVVVSFHDATNAAIGGYNGLGFGVIANDD